MGWVGLGLGLGCSVVAVWAAGYTRLPGWRKVTGAQTLFHVERTRQEKATGARGTSEAGAERRWRRRRGRGRRQMEKAKGDTEHGAVAGQAKRCREREHSEEGNAYKGGEGESVSCLTEQRQR